MRYTLVPACYSKAEGYNDISGYWNSEQMRKACGDFSNYPALKAVANRVAPALHLDGIATMLDELARA